MKPIVVFGGSFNPPTNAHFSLVEQILNEFDVEKVLIMPVGDFYIKEGLLPSKHRVAMLERACASFKGIEVSMIEVNANRQLPTIETLEYLAEENPSTPIWFVLGTDNLRDLPNWDRYEDLLSQFKILALERGDDSVSQIVKETSSLERFEQNIIKISEEVRSNCSSTIVRNRLRSGKYVQSLIPYSVLSYIQDNQLYK